MLARCAEPSLTSLGHFPHYDLSLLGPGFGYLHRLCRGTLTGRRLSRGAVPWALGVLRALYPLRSTRGARLGPKQVPSQLPCRRRVPSAERARRAAPHESGVQVAEELLVGWPTVAMVEVVVPHAREEPAEDARPQPSTPSLSLSLRLRLSLRLSLSLSLSVTLSVTLTLALAQALSRACGRGVVAVRWCAPRRA